ncbi:MAG TPA: hypothetical protein VGL02_19765, partial [Streptomyces sp.]
APPPVEIVSVACREGLLVLGRYLRLEPWEPSAELPWLREVHDEASEAFAAEQRGNQEFEAELREAAARQRRLAQSLDAD